MVGFVFYDTETTGLRPGWDQIVQFAAIRTDESLNEVERFETRCRLQPHTIPHPSALLANGLSIHRLADPQLPSHYRMICQVRTRLLAWSPAIFVGFNSIRFDEEMLRHSFFQSLHPAYLTSGHGNARADVLTLALAASALPPPCLEVPLGENGRPTFKLARLAAANGLVADGAHDAMADAEMTLSLARMVRDRSTELWQRFVRFSKKATVSDFVGGEDAFVLTEFFGNEPYHRVVAVIGPVPDNPNGRFCFDLSEDPAAWTAMDDDTLRAAVARKGGPVRRLAVNAAPALAALWEAPESMIGGLDVDLLELRARELQGDAALRTRIIEAARAQWSARSPSPHPEEQLYDGGFPCAEDEQRMREFHEAERLDRTRLAEQFEDPRLKVFARRLVHSEHRGGLDQAARLKGDLILAQRLLDHDGALTLAAAARLIDEMTAAGASDPHGLLQEYLGWLAARRLRVEAFLGQKSTTPAHA